MATATPDQMASLRRHGKRSQRATSFEMLDGKIKRFDCYPEGSVVLTQVGVIGASDSVLEY